MVALGAYSFRTNVETQPKICHNSLHNFSMIRSIVRLTPTQRQWRKVQRNRQRRVTAPAIGLLLTSAAIFLTVAMKIAPHDFGTTTPTEATSRVTILRGGNAWNHATSDTATPSSSVVGRVTHVRDGDTIEVAGRPIRFTKLDCAEIGTPDGRRADRLMKELASGQTLSCSLTGQKSYDRWLGSCRLPDGRDLATAMVQNGACTWWRS